MESLESGWHAACINRQDIEVNEPDLHTCASSISSRSSIVVKVVSDFIKSSSRADMLHLLEAFAMALFPCDRDRMWKPWCVQTKLVKLFALWFCIVLAWISCSMFELRIWKAWLCKKMRTQRWRECGLLNQSIHIHHILRIRCPGRDLPAWAPLGVWQAGVEFKPRILSNSTDQHLLKLRSQNFIMFIFILDS